MCGVITKVEIRNRNTFNWAEYLKKKFKNSRLLSLLPPPPLVLYMIALSLFFLSIDRRLNEAKRSRQMSSN